MEKSAVQSDNNTRLSIGRKYGEKVLIGNAWVWIEKKGENGVVLHINAPPEVRVYREELLNQEKKG